MRYELEIARTWRGRATKEKAEDYLRHFETGVVQNLKGIPGNTGAYLMRRDADGGVEFLALTFWDSIDAIKRFFAVIPRSLASRPRAGLP
jgi:heme-degrading monooxygenase HmoA